MLRCDVTRIGDGYAIDFHPRVSVSAGAEALSGADSDHGTATTQRQDQPDQLRSGDARRAPQANHSGGAIDGTPDSARVTRDPGNGRRPNRATTASVRRVESRLPRCRTGSIGRATAATSTTPGEMRRSAALTSARATTALTVQRTRPADVGTSAAADSVLVWHDGTIVSPTRAGSP